jgi:hypothetical protein
MDKSRLLREFAARADKEALDLDAIRLYLLLLADSRKGQGRLPVREIREAGFSPLAQLAASQALVDQGLIELDSSSPATGPEEGAVLGYRLLPVKEWRSRAD